MGRRSDELRPQLKKAQQSLQKALHEACAMDLNKVNTGELIHIDELLAIAGDSAKQAISVRRRLRKESSGKGRISTTRSAANTSAMAAAEPRVFEDSKSVRWTTFAVRPSSDRTLSGPYQKGWLSFDSGAETRRLAPIPDGWNTLSDAELRQLCERAKVAPRRRK
jgi:hypothetical protein